jgi:hypothetical protein
MPRRGPEAGDPRKSDNLHGENTVLTSLIAIVSLRKSHIILFASG